MRALRLQWRWLAAGAVAGMVVLGGLAVMIMVLWPTSATMEIQVNGWTLPVRGVFSFNSDEVPQGLRFLFPWSDGIEVAVTVGAVSEDVEDNTLVVTPYDGSDDQKFDLPDNVRVYWGFLPRSPASLTERTPVMVFSVDERVDLILAGLAGAPGRGDIRRRQAARGGHGGRFRL